MSKIFNKLIISGLVVISVFGIIPAVKANAQNLGGFVVTGGYNPQPQPPSYYPVPQPVYVPTYVPVPEPVPVYVAPTPAPTPTVYSNSANPNPPIAKKTVAKPKPKPAETNSELTANAIFGSDTFLPSGLVQWILFAILILLIVILIRKIYGADVRYRAAPLKHD
ncbi:hypothetical protein HYZ82_02250 [Candidatus Nomurabacteria bacterium]|nr:hypothetical protein [Candidatus Nomurabacteria bacterium]